MRAGGRVRLAGGFERAEAPAERDLALVVEALVVEHQHRMGVERAADFREGRVIHRQAGIDPADLGAEVGMQRCDRDRHSKGSDPPSPRTRGEGGGEGVLNLVQPVRPAAANLVRDRQRLRDRYLVGSSGPVAARATIARISSRWNQRASAISSGSTVISSLIPSARKPIIKVEGNGQGCAARYLTRPTLTPASSMTSRRTHSSGVSPGSMNPARHEKREPGRRLLRPSSPYSPRTVSMIVTGSARG